MTRSACYVIIKLIIHLQKQALCLTAQSFQPVRKVWLLKMKIKLLMNAISKLLLGLIFTGILLFLPAGTFRYWNAWLFIGLLFIPMLIRGFILFIKAPDLLAKRMNSKEKEQKQKVVILWSFVLFIAGFTISALDFRYQWTNIPLWLVIAASILLILSYLLYGEVMRENAYLSRTVEIQKDQKVIDTGLYGIVRHPMYTVTILLFISFPIVLGSAIALIPFLFYPLLFIRRIKNEETVLENGLQGYKEYKERVRYRLFPYLY